MYKRQVEDGEHVGQRAARRLLAAVDERRHGVSFLGLAVGGHSLVGKPDPHRGLIPIAALSMLETNLGEEFLSLFAGTPAG